MRDVRRLAGLEEFTKFFDFVTNPEEYRTLIQDAKLAVQEWEQANVTARKIKDVDEWRHEVEVAFSDKEREFKEKQESFERRKKDEELRLVKIREDIGLVQKQTEEAVKQVDTKLDLLKDLENQAQVLQKRVNELNERERVFNLLDAELKQRVAKFAALVKE